MNCVNCRGLHWISLILISTLIASCISSGRKPSALYSNEFSNESLIAAYDHPSDPSFSDLLNVIQKNQAKQVSTALGNLKAELPQYMKGYTLLYYSRSLQDASFLNPRAIVFGEIARTVISFNGSPEQGGYDALETIEYDRGEYTMREILFVNEDPKNPRHMASEEIDIALSTPNIEVSKANIPRCIACHGDRPRPIWDNYFIWSGVYGSQDDRIFRRAQNILFLNNETIEQPEFETYVRKQLRPKWIWQKPHPRYSKLDEHTTYVGEVRPNATLTQLFAAQSMHRLARDIKAIKKGKERFVAAVKKHKTRPNFLSYDQPSQFENLDYNLDVANRHLALVGKGVDQHALEFDTDNLGSSNLDPTNEEDAFLQIRKFKSPDENPELLIDYYKQLKEHYPKTAPINLFAGAIRAYANNSRDRCFSEALSPIGLDFRNYVINRERAPTLSDGTDLCDTLANYLTSWTR